MRQTTIVSCSKVSRVNSCSQQLFQTHWSDFLTHLTTDDALASFVDQRPDLLVLAQKVVGCPDIAEDLVQDCWLRWSGHHYEAANARPILFRIVKNLAIDWYRRRKTEARNLEAHALTCDDAPDTEQVVIYRQRVNLVLKALSELPERNVTAFRLSRIHGFTYKDIGKRLNVSEATAYRLVGDALVNIVLHLEP